MWLQEPRCTAGAIERRYAYEQSIREWILCKNVPLHGVDPLFRSQPYGAFIVCTTISVWSGLWRHLISSVVCPVGHLFSCSEGQSVGTCGGSFASTERTTGTTVFGVDT